MPMPALLLLIAALMPLGAAALLAGGGRRLGNPLAGWIATGAVGVAFALSLGGMIAWFNGGQIADTTWGPNDKPIELSYRWLPLGSAAGTNHVGFLDLDICVDSLTIAMFNTVTLLSLLAQLFATAYMPREKALPIFFAGLSLLTAAVLGIVIAQSLLHAAIFFPLMTISAWVLVGHDGHRAAAARTLIANMIGDCVFLIGVACIAARTGTLNLLQLDRWLTAPGVLGSMGGHSIPPGWMTCIGLALFAGIAVKAAQFPLQFWLLDAADGPVPVSALLQSIALPAAGVYLLARLFPLLTPSAMLAIAMIGAITLTAGAMMALAQSDLLGVLAAAAVSQFGLIVLAFGIGSWSGGLFHLIAHSFFAALLVLAAGSVLRATGGQRLLENLGGLLRSMPVTAAAFGVGALALAGLPFFSGYFGQQSILADAAAFAGLAARQGRSPAYGLLFALPALAAYVLPLAAMRCWMLCFWGEPRTRLATEPRESAALWTPMLVLAGLSILGGTVLLDIRAFVAQASSETQNLLDESGWRWPGFAHAWPGESSGEQEQMRDVVTPASRAPYLAGQRLARSCTRWAWAIGLLVGFAAYVRGPTVTAFLLRPIPLRNIRAWLSERMYFDELYSYVFAGGTWVAARCGAMVDRALLLPTPDNDAGGPGRLAAGGAIILATVAALAALAVLLLR